jgi:CubicO group peptidase (beta-lactamase class C family)
MIVASVLIRWQIQDSSFERKTEMNTKTRIKSLFLLHCGLAIALLSSCGTSAVISTGANAGISNASMDLPFTSTTGGDPDPKLDEKLAQFEGYLADMQQELAIPGMSVAIVKDQELLWAQGFGYADVGTARPAAADTPYEIASLTKTLSSTILLQLVEQGKVNLDDPVSKYGVYIKGPGVIRVKHLLGHTSEREPGSLFLYNGGRYARLQKVIERASGKPFAELVAETLLDPLGMSDSAPFHLLDQPAYQDVREKLSKPYSGDRSYWTWFSTSGGFVSTVLDLAKFDIALDQDRLIRPETRALAFTAQTLTSGEPPVYGLGWYADEFQGTQIAWHQGWWNYFHLYVKFLDPEYSLIVFTNSTTLGQFTSSEDVSVMRYPVALAFYKLFIMDMDPGDMIDWEAEEAVIASQLQAAQSAGVGEIARQEIHDRYLTAQILGKSASARKALDTYIRFFTSPELPDVKSQSPFAMVDRVGNNTYSIVEFTLQQDTDVDIFAVGGYWLGQMWDYGGIEDVSSGKLIWMMTPDRASPAGGVGNNRQVNERITLPAGTYRLHFRTDEAHSFGNWLDLPPDTLFWGIALYAVGENTGITTRNITPSIQDKLLPAQVPQIAPPISKLEYAILWTCLGILLSTLVVIPVALRRLKNPVGLPKKVRGWTNAAAWVMWANCLLSPLLIFVLMKFFDLESLVTEPPILVSTTAVFQVLILTGVIYACIALTTFQVGFSILAWAGKFRSLVERLYYSLVTVTAIGFYVLLGSWGLILALN